MPKDLRSFIDDVQAKAPEDIARVNRSISPRYEITALLTQLERKKRFPLLLPLWAGRGHYNLNLDKIAFACYLY